VRIGIGPPSVHPTRHDLPGMSSRKLMIGRRAALAGLFARLRGRAEPAPPPPADPEVGDIEVHELREDLRRELERLANADIKAWRTRREATPPPG